MQPAASRVVALTASALSVLLVAVVAATPGSTFQPVQPAAAYSGGPFRALADRLGLGGLGPVALAATGVAAVMIAAVAFALLLVSAWRGRIGVRDAVVLTLAYHGVVLLLPLLFSRDVYSYGLYGRIAGVYHANPYVSTPANFPHDVLAAYVGPRWYATPDVYGPVWTLICEGIARVWSSVASMIAAFRVLAVLESLGTVAIVAATVRSRWPERAAFAVAAFGANPVVLFQSVASGHNDLLVALAVAAAFALLVIRRELAATATLALGALVKASALVPLVLLLVAIVARRPQGSRLRTALAHLGVAGGVALATALPFLNTRDPTLGMLELASHEGWLAPSRFFHRLLAIVSLGWLARIAFAAALVATVVALCLHMARRRDPSVLEQGAAWGWGLLALMLLGPVLLPWYVTWSLPLVWLLPRVPRSVLIGVSLSLIVSQWTTEPTWFPAAYDANLLVGHYVITPVVIALLGWFARDLRRRLRAGAPLSDEAEQVPAESGEG